MEYEDIQCICEYCSILNLGVGHCDLPLSIVFPVRIGLG